MGLTLVTPASTYPVTLAEAKAHCEVDPDITRHDDRIDALIAAATEYVEQYTGRSIMAQTWKVTYDAFADALQLPKGPVTSVTNVKYYDTAGAEQTVSSGDYTADLSSDPQWIVRNSDASWPATLTGVNVVSVTYVTGYSTVPAPIKHAILLLIGQWYDNRMAAGEREQYEMPNSVGALLANYRSYGF